MTFSYDDVRRLASDPESDWDTLHWIAEEYPELRPAVAANPATYPELLEALADLGDPTITTALMRRFNPDADPSELPEPTDGIPFSVRSRDGTDGDEDDMAVAAADAAAGAPEEDPPGAGENAATGADTTEPPGPREPTRPTDLPGEEHPHVETAWPTGPTPVVETHAESEAAPGPGSPAAPAAPSADTPSEASTATWARTSDAQWPSGSGVASSVAETRGTARNGSPGELQAAPRNAGLPPVGTAAPEAARAILRAGTVPAGPRPRGAPGGTGAGDAATARPVEDRPRRSRVSVLLFAVILPLIALAAITTLIVMLLGDSGSPSAVPDAPGGAAETGSSRGSSESEASPTRLTLEELHTAVSELPQTSSCEDVTDDVDVFTAYAERAAEEDSWSTEDDELVQGTVEELQAECGALQSAQVHQQLTDQSAAGIAAAAEDMGTGWIEIAFPADGAAELTSFMTPSGNIRCKMGDRLHCSVVEHDFAAPEGCDEAEVTTFQSTLRTTSAADCEDPVEEADREILHYGQKTANEYFACQSLRSKLSCWNQITGEGFNLSRSTHSTY